MKRNVAIIFLVLILFLVSYGTSVQIADLKTEAQKLQTQITAPNLELEASRELYRVGAGFYSITAQEMSQFIWFLAGPECEGRGSGTRGNEIAGNFLATELETYFLDQNLFQDFEFPAVKNPREGYKVIKYLSGEGFKVSGKGKNIIGILEGGQKKDEYIIVSAHYDHLGVNEKGELFPGADDNASGTAAVLEIAEAFGILARDGIRPNRSIIFAFFDAEEAGLFGSQYFVENPPVPFEQIVAVINLDMVGRNEPDKLKVAGSEKIPLFFQTMAKANMILRLELIADQSFFDRSDQASFFYASPKDNRLPVVFYNTGEHSDYHTLADTADKINFEKVQNIARFTFFVAWLISSLEEKPVYQE